MFDYRFTDSDSLFGTTTTKRYEGQLTGTGLLARKLEFWLPPATGVVHFAAMLHGDRPEVRDAILQSAGTLSVG